MMSALESIPDPKYPKPGFGYSEETNPNVYVNFNYLPKISVVIPCFQQGPFVEQAIRSVLAQNYPGIEIIVADGGSTDESVKIIKYYSASLNWWASEKGNGTYDQINNGLGKMSGDYWVVLNAENTLWKDCIFNVVKLLNEETEVRPEWITGSVNFLDEESKIIGTIEPHQPKPIAGYSFADSCWIFHPATFLSAKVYSVTGKFKASDVTDYDYWVRMERTRYFPVVIPVVLASLRHQKKSNGPKYVNTLKDVKLVIQGIYNEQRNELSFEQMKEFRDKIKYWDILYLKTFILYNIFDKQKIDALKKLLYTVLTYPDQFFKRWYWGALKRLFTGVQEWEFSQAMFFKYNSGINDKKPALSN